MRTMATTLWLCWLTSSPILAQDNTNDDPLVGDKRLSAWKTLLIDEHVNVRRQAAESLGEIGPKAKPTVPALIERLTDSRSVVRNRAADALGEIGLAAIPALLKTLAANDAVLRRRTARAIGNTGAEDATVVSALKALEDEESGVRFSASQALGKMPAAAPSLVTVLESGAPTARYWATVALGRIGVRSDPVLPALINALNDGDKNVRAGAASALGKIGPQARSAIPALKEMLNDPE